jgi:hypothetical protein
MSELPIDSYMSWRPVGEAALEASHSLRGFYETAGVVKVFVFAFVFSLLAFLFLRLFLVRVL